ncbi:MAG: hypothetical protein LBH05_08215 [Deferribacteraceae bacterium]|jgi:hypothetical protein|nr:hypothetical protein [Deferribacteraceae bacterium]
MNGFDVLNKKKGNFFKEITLLFVICVGIVLFATGVVRGRCISIGYDLSRMSEEIEQLRVRIDNSEASRSAVISKEILFQLATDSGFILMEDGKTFNVQR